MTIPRPAQLLSDHITIFLSECGNTDKNTISLKNTPQSAKMSKKTTPDICAHERLEPRQN